MIKLLLFFLNLEGKVNKAVYKADSSGKKTSKNPADTNVESTYVALKKTTEPYRSEASSPSFRGRVGATVKNIANIARNAFDNTAGYGIAKYQNYATKKHFKKNPEGKESVVYLMHGSFQNEGSQWRLARQLKKAGYKPLHLKGQHHLPREEAANKAFNQIEGFHKEVNIKKPYSRRDYFSGHSSGADLGIYMAGDKRLAYSGIKAVQARAPVPYGINKPATLAQRLIMPFVKADDTRTALGKRNAVEMAIRKPFVPVHILAGKYDRLVTPADAIYGHATTYKVIDHPAATHFGTSGGHSEMNEVSIKELAGYSKKNKYKYEKR